MDRKPYVTDYDEAYRSFRLHLPNPFNIAHLICDRHSSRRDKLAMIFEDERGETRKLTFGQLKELSDRLAIGLRTLGVRKSDRVAFLLPSSPEIYLAYLAVFKLGAVALPISTLFGREGVEYRIQDSGARTLITVPEARPNLEGVRDAVQVVMLGEAEEGEVRFADLIERGASLFEPEPTTGGDDVLLIYSSGTTGPPKGVLHTHGSLLHTFETEKFWTDVHPEDLHWSAADPTWLGGIMTDLLCAWPVGATILKLRRYGGFDPEHAFHLMSKWRVTNLFAPPTAYRMMARFDRVQEQNDLSALQCCVSGGEPLNPEIIYWGREELKLTVLDGYGQTEGIMMTNNFRTVPVKPGSMGKASPGCRLRLVDEEGRDVEAGEVGQIVVHRETPFLFKAYWNKPAETEASYLGDWYRTGDTATRDEEGYITFVGRADDVIISAGYRIGPFEVESCMIEHSAVAESAAVAKPDPEGIRGHIVKGYVVVKQGYAPSPELAREIQEHVKGRLSRTEYPREIEFIDELPKTRSGKIIRKELRQRAKAEYDAFMRRSGGGGASEEDD